MPVVLASPERAAQAARSALMRQLHLARRGRSMLHPFIGRSKRFEPWEHYPHRDAVDDAGRWQFYFHAHEPEPASDARHPQEHGHIHLFRRGTQGRLTHVAGLALDARGLPLCWFATNQWVTAERWRDAPGLLRDLQSIELRLSGPLAGAALWLADMVRFYQDPLAHMLLARDQALEQHCTRYGQTRQQAWADRRVAIWRSFPVRWPQDALAAGGLTNSLH